VSIQNKKSRAADRRCPPTWVMSRAQSSSPYKDAGLQIIKQHFGLQALSLEPYRQSKSNTKFGY
jgi:hypothetical protein